LEQNTQRSEAAILEPFGLALQEGAIAEFFALTVRLRPKRHDAPRRGNGRGMEIDP